MDLIDGLNHYKNNSFYQRTLNLEEEGKTLLQLISAKNKNPSPPDLEKAKQFLIAVEKWKADCLLQRMGNADKNSSKDIWDAIHESIMATSDRTKLLAIMKLKGFGSSVDENTGQRRAKVATSVLRFLWPEDWGVVDWRIAAMLGFLEKNQWNIEKSIEEARSTQAQEHRNLFYIIDELGATEYNKKYRVLCTNKHPEITRAADADMAIFGLSLIAWPIR